MHLKPSESAEHGLLKTSERTQPGDMSGSAPWVWVTLKDGCLETQGTDDLFSNCTQKSEVASLSRVVQNITG